MGKKKNLVLFFFAILILLTGIQLGTIIRWDDNAKDSSATTASTPSADSEPVNTSSPAPAEQSFSSENSEVFPNLAYTQALSDSSLVNYDEQQNITVYELRNEAVVNIITETIAYNWFFEPIPQSGDSGSGSIIDKRGYVLTNKHVIENANKIYITLADGSRYEGKVVGSDNENDLAILFFDPEGKELSVIPLGRSDALKIGQKVLAIGNPFALERTLTTGIISGLGRPVRTQSKLVINDMIQTDASINVGNSGGPLLNGAGDMIGVNTMIYSLSGGSLGIGFAIPVNTARRVIPDLIQYGSVQRGWIDIIPRRLFPELVQYAELPVSQGVLVSQVVEGGNANKAGIRGGSKDNAVRYGNTIIYLGGDIIVDIGGHPVASIANIYEALEESKPGERISVVFMRDKKRHTVELVLSERPEGFQWD